MNIMYTKIVSTYSLQCIDKNKTGIIFFYFLFLHNFFENVLLSKAIFPYSDFFVMLTDVFFNGDICLKSALITQRYGWIVRHINVFLSETDMPILFFLSIWSTLCMAYDYNLCE